MSTHAVAAAMDERSSRAGNARREHSAPREIGRPVDIGRGSVLVEPGTSLPDSLTPRLRRVGSWNVIGADSFTLARALTKENLHFSFVVPAIKKVSTGRTRGKAVRAAVEKLVQAVKACDFNAVEVTSVVTNRLFGIYRVQITGHASHISDSPFLNDRHGPRKEKRTSAFVTHSVLLDIANTPQRLRRLIKGVYERTRQWSGDRQD
jgi:hypothetical protein